MRQFPGTLASGSDAKNPIAGGGLVGTAGDGYEWGFDAPTSPGANRRLAFPGSLPGIAGQAPTYGTDGTFAGWETPRNTPAGTETIEYGEEFAARIQAALDDEDVGHVILAGNGVCNLEHNLLISRPVWLTIPSGMTLRLADDATLTNGQTDTSELANVHVVAMLKVTADDVTIECHGTLDSNYDNLFEADNPSPGISRYPTTIWGWDADRLTVSGRWQVINSRGSLQLVDCDDVYIVGGYHHTPPASVDPLQSFFFSTEGSTRITVVKCRVDGVGEVCDFNAVVGGASFYECAFIDCRAFESNGSTGFTFDGCYFQNTRIFDYQPPSDYGPRFSAAPTPTVRPDFSIRNCRVYFDTEMSTGPLLWFRNNTNGLYIDGLYVHLTVVPSQPLIKANATSYGESPTTIEHINVNIRNLKVYAPDLTLTQPVIDFDSRLADSDVEVAVIAAGSSVNVLQFERTLRCRLRPFISLSGGVLVTPMYFDNPTHTVVDRPDVLGSGSDTLISAVAIGTTVNSQSGGLRIINAEWQPASVAGSYLGLVDSADDRRVSTDSRFADYVRSLEPTFWYRSKTIGDAISGTVGTSSGTVTSKGPPLVISPPGGSITLNATGVVDLGDLAGFDFGEGDFTLHALVKYTASTGDGRIVNKGVFSAATPHVELMVRNTGTVTGRVCNGSTTVAVTTSANYADGLWHSFWLVRSGDNLQIYIDDASSTAASGTGADALNVDNTEEVLIGASTTDGTARSSYFGAVTSGGAVAQVMAFNRALTATERANLHYIARGMRSNW